MSGHTPWKEIRRKSQERIARNRLELWLTDCLESGESIPDLNTFQTKILLSQIEEAAQDGGEEVQAERNMWRARAVSFGQWISRIKKAVDAEQDDGS